MTRILGSGNPDFGVVQTNAYLDRVEAMPYSQIALSAFGEIVDLPAHQAEIFTIRSMNQININNQLLVPLNLNGQNPERIGKVKGSVTTMKANVYGVSIIIGEYSAVHSPESIFTAVSTLLSDYEMRLKERIIYNALQNANLILYRFSKGGSGSTKKANILDLIEVTDLMEENEVAPCMEFMSASPNEYTRPVPHRYAMVSSIKGASAFKKNLSVEEFTQTHRYAGLTEYGFLSKGTVERANIELFASTEIDKGTEGEREGFVIGLQAFFTTGKTPLNSVLFHRKAGESTYGLTHKLEKRTTTGVALASQNRVVKIVFAD